MIDEKKLIEILSRNSIFAKITNAEGKNVFEIIKSLQKNDCAECEAVMNLKAALYDRGEQNGWILCKTQLPEDKKIVLFQTKNERMYVGYYDSRFKSFECVTARNSHVKGLKPVVWRTLPTPYKELKND